MGATNGTIDFALGNLHKFYNTYADNTAANPLTFLPDGKAIAGSPAFIVMPVGAYLHDISLDADPGTVTNLIIKKDDHPVATLGVKNHLASVVTRPRPNVWFNKGEKLTIIEA